MEKSAARDACFPSLPTIPTPFSVRMQTGLAILTNVGRLNHADIVTAVADAADSLAAELANQTSNIGLLRRRTTTGYHSRQLSRQCHKFGAELVKTQLTVSCQSPEELTCKDPPSITRQQSGLAWTKSSMSLTWSRVCTAMSASPRRIFLTLCNLVNVLVAGNKFARHSNVGRSFNLIASQHPNLQTGISEKFER